MTFSYPAATPAQGLPTFRVDLNEEVSVVYDDNRTTHRSATLRNVSPGGIGLIFDYQEIVLEQQSYLGIEFQPGATIGGRVAWYRRTPSPTSPNLGVQIHGYPNTPEISHRYLRWLAEVSSKITL